MKGKLEGEKEVFPLISGFGYQMSWFLFLHQLTILPKKKKKKKCFYSECDFRTS